MKVHPKQFTAYFEGGIHALVSEASTLGIAPNAPMPERVEVADENETQVFVFKSADRYGWNYLDPNTGDHLSIAND